MISLEKVTDSVNRYLALQKIVELGSFTRAAEALGYTQSAMSQMIASLEEELSIKLLIRSRTGARAELYPYVERLVGQYWAAQEKANEIKGLETGVVRMGTLASISVHWLPGLLRDFQARYPPAWSSCSSAKNFKKKFENRSCIFWRSVVTYIS